MSINKFYPYSSKHIICGPDLDDNNFNVPSALRFSNNESNIIEKEITQEYEFEQFPRSIYNLKVSGIDGWRLLPINSITKIYGMKDVEIVLSLYIRFLIAGQLKDLATKEYVGRIQLSLRVAEQDKMIPQVYEKMLRYYNEITPVLDNIKDIYNQTTEIFNYEYLYGGNLKNPLDDARRFVNLDEECEYYDENKYEGSTLKNYMRNIKFTPNKNKDLYFILFWNVEAEEDYPIAYDQIEIRKTYLKFENICRDDHDRFIVGTQPEGSFIDAMPNYIATFYQYTNSFYFEKPYIGQEIMVHKPFGIYKFNGNIWVQTLNTMDAFGILPIEHGGTSANNKEDAIINLNSVYIKDLISKYYPLEKNCKYFTPLFKIQNRMAEEPIIYYDAYGFFEIFGSSDIDDSVEIKATVEVYLNNIDPKTIIRPHARIIYYTKDDMIRGINFGICQYEGIYYFAMQVDTNETTGKFYTRLKFKGMTSDIKSIKNLILYERPDVIVLPEVYNTCDFTYLG